MSRPDSDLFLQGVHMLVTDEERLLLHEAGQRCGVSIADFALMAALSAARQIVPKACQPSEAGLVETALPGLFDGKEGG